VSSSLLSHRSLIRLLRAVGAESISEDDAGLVVLLEIGGSNSSVPNLGLNIDMDRWRSG